MSFIKTTKQEFKILVMYSPRCVKQRTALPEINPFSTNLPITDKPGSYQVTTRVKDFHLLKVRTIHKVFEGNNNNNNNNNNKIK